MSIGATESSATFHSEATVMNAGSKPFQSLKLSTSIYDMHDRLVSKVSSAAVTIDAGASTVLSTAVNVQDVALWSVVSPNTYRVVLEATDQDAAVVDAVTVTTGVRTVRSLPDASLHLPISPCTSLYLVPA